MEFSQGMPTAEGAVSKHKYYTLIGVFPQTSFLCAYTYKRAVFLLQARSYGEASGRGRGRVLDDA
jgi:hypothetical protein